MNIQDLYIEKFRNEIRVIYVTIYDFFDPFDGDGLWEPEYEEIQKAFGQAAAQMRDHVVRDQFVSEASRQKVLSDLSKGEELMMKLNPHSKKIVVVTSMINRILIIDPIIN